MSRFTKTAWVDNTTPAITAAQLNRIEAGIFSVLGSFYNVSDYGATGDGVTDDRAAIQSALDAANTAGGGTVYFPKGTYLLVSALNPKTNVTLLGAGPRVSVLKANAASTSMLATNASNLSGWTVEGLGFDLGSFTDVFGVKIINTGCDYVKIRNCEFKNIDSGVGAESAAIFGNNGTKTVIENCTFLGPANATTTTATSKGIYGIGWDSFQVRGCTLNGVAIPMQIQNGCTHFLIANCNISQHGVRGIEIEGCSNAAVVGNVFRESTFVANSGAAQLAIAVAVVVYGVTRTHHIVVSANEFYYTGTNTATAVGSFGSHHLVVQGNNCTGAGFEVSYTADGSIVCDSDIISDNTVTGPGYGTGCFFSGSNSRVSGNVFTNCDSIAVEIAEAHDFYFTHNIIQTNTNDGLFIAKSGPNNTGCQDIVVAYNDITACTNGIEVQSDALNTRMRLEFNDLVGNSSSAITVGALATHVRRFGNLTVNADYDANLLTPVATVALTYGTTVNTDASLARYFTLGVTNTTAFTMAAPTNVVAGDSISFDIKNSSGGTMGAVTWNAAFLLAGAFTNPANTKRRTITFTYDGTSWIETGRAAADI